VPVKSSQEMDVETRLANMLATAGARDRVNIEKHLAVLDAEPEAGHGQLWRRIAAKLAELAPLPVHTAASQVVLFFIADGKYRMQVFALEDMRDGLLTVYLPDVMTKAVREKLIVKDGDHYAAPGAAKKLLTVQQMDASNTAHPPEYVKHMVGWNRKAVKMTLQTSDPDGPQVAVAEKLCALAAKQWVSAAPADAKS
jgi:hypothetical protein